MATSITWRPPPPESTTYRFAKHDKAEFPGIITANENGTPYYTNSSHLPVGVHRGHFLGTGCAGRAPDLAIPPAPCSMPSWGEKLPSWQAAAALVRKIAENYNCPIIPPPPPPVPHLLRVRRPWLSVRGAVHLPPRCRFVKHLGR